MNEEKWMNVWMSELVSYWLSEWASGRVDEWVSKWVSEWASEWASEWVGECMCEWVSTWVIACITLSANDFDLGLANCFPSSVVVCVFDHDLSAESSVLLNSSLGLGWDSFSCYKTK